MADTGKVTYSVSMTPITSLGTAAGKYGAIDVINADIGKSLGGGGDITITNEYHTTVGYGSASDGTVAYANCIANGGAKTQLGADATAYDFMFIKHTGFQYSSATALGAVTAHNLLFYIETAAASTWQLLCTIPPGGAICLPNTSSPGSSKGWWVESSSTDTIAVEYALIV